MNVEQLAIINEYISLGFPVFPCNSDKTPMCQWTNYESKIADFTEAEYVGLRMGGKKKLFAIDFDLKNCSDERLMHKYSDMVSIDILNKVVSAETVNGGFHFLFQVDNPDNNRKYAMNTKDETVIESRGTGGYIIIAPSEGYKFRGGKSLIDIQHLTDDEFSELTSVASMFDQSLHKRVYKAAVPEERYTKSDSDKITPWDDFDRNTDFIEFIKGYGWKVFREKGDRIYLTRPDKNTGISGDWHKGYNLFKCWTSNASPLEQGVAYTPYHIYTLYEFGCDTDNFRQSAKKLYSEGWGDRLTKEEEVILDKDDPYNYVFQESQIRKDLMDYFDGKIEVGKSTGSYIIDEYFKFKNNEFVQIVGHSNVGKTFFFKYIMAMGIQFAGMKFIVAATENRAWDFIDDMVSFILCMRANKANESQKEIRASVIKKVQDSVVFLKTNDMSIFGLLDVARGLFSSKKKKFDAILIDPLNGFMIDHKIKGEGASYHTQCAAALLSFAGEYCSVYLNTHTIVGSQRGFKDMNTGKRKVPNKSDAEYGGNYGNKADSIIIIDRDIDSENGEDHLVTKMWVKKVRTQKLGGKYNTDSNPICFTFNHNTFGFDIKCDGKHENNPLIQRSPLRVEEHNIHYYSKDSRELENDFLNNKDPF